jgi:hypothetical protein
MENEPINDKQFSQTENPQSLTLPAPKNELVQTDEEFVFSEVASDALLQAARWAKFIGIAGYVYSVILALVSVGLLAFNRYRNEYPVERGGRFVFYIIMTGVMLFLSSFLMNFSKSAIQAIENQETALLDNAMQNLRKYFKVLGFTIIAAFVLITLSLLIILISLLI